jgi:capsid protein
VNRKIVRSSSKHHLLPAAVKTASGKLSVQLSKTGNKTTALFGSGSGSGYVTFGSNRKSMRGAFAFANPVSVDIDPKLEKIRASSRDLFMNSPIATGILKRARTNIINSGLILQARIDREFLGLSDKEADAKEEQIEREFNIWSRSKNCDAFRRLDFYAMQGLALISKLMSGDVFAALPYIPRAGWPYQLCIKLIEADFVSNPNSTMDTETLISGVETDITGQVVAYHISNRHPNDIYPNIGIRRKKRAAEYLTFVRG